MTRPWRPLQVHTPALCLKIRSKSFQHTISVIDLTFNGQHELQKLWFVKWIDKTNEATWRNVLSYNSAQNQAWFARGTLICTMKATNYYPKVGNQITDLVWIESSLYKGEPVCRPNSPVLDLTCRDHLSRADFCQQVQWFAPLLNFLVLRPLNHFSSASRCDGGSWSAASRQAPRRSYNISTHPSFLYQCLHALLYRD